MVSIGYCDVVLISTLQGTILSLKVVKAHIKIADLHNTTELFLINFNQYFTRFIIELVVSVTSIHFHDGALALADSIDPLSNYPKCHLKLQLATNTSAVLTYDNQNTKLFGLQ